MTAQGEDILAWLNAAITRREEAAREAARSYGPRWARPVDTDLVRVAEDVGIWFQALSQEIAEHVVYNDPESVLRRCATDRKLLELHAPIDDGTQLSRDYPQCKTCFDQDSYDPEWSPCPTVLALAEGYGWTGGER